MSSLSGLARTLPPPLAQQARRLWSRPRYWYQRLASARGYRRHGDRYPNSCLFVAGLPKSGTSWLEGMLASLPGFHTVMPPEAVEHELEHGGSHRFQMPDDLFQRLDEHLYVLKLHGMATPRNAALLERKRVPYVVLHRDLRDVAVSHYFYVRRAPWHPEHPAYRRLSVEEGLLHFAETLLQPFVQWIRSWKSNLNPELGLELRYEELLADTTSTFERTLSHYGVEAPPGFVERTVRAHSFRTMSRGRSRGTEDRTSFQRKGIVGDWKNHFTPAVERAFASRAGGMLDEPGDGKESLP